jgi:hypothetical protein
MKIGSLRSTCAAGHALVALGLTLLAGAWIASAAAGGSASAAAPARVSVQIPAETKLAGVVMLELGVKLVRRPAAGKLGGLVRLSPPNGAGAVEVGRFSVSSAEHQRFQFNVADAIKRFKLAGSQALVEIALIDRAGGSVPSGAELAIGHARIVTR